MSIPRRAPAARAAPRTVAAFPRPPTRTRQRRLNESSIRHLAVLARRVPRHDRQREQQFLGHQRRQAAVPIGLPGRSRIPPAPLAACASLSTTTTRISALTSSRIAPRQRWQTGVSATCKPDLSPWAGHARDRTAASPGPAHPPPQIRPEYRAAHPVESRNRSARATPPIWPNRAAWTSPPAWGAYDR